MKYKYFIFSYFLLVVLIIVIAGQKKPPNKKQSTRKPNPTRITSKKPTVKPSIKSSRGTTRVTKKPTVRPSIKPSKATTTTKKTIVKYEIKKWQTPISYFISNDFKNKDEAKMKIESVIKEIKENTCIKFNEEDTKLIDKRGINFKISNKCENMRIGTNTEEKHQNIYLTNDCVKSMRTIRYLLHNALGQLSPVLQNNRDKYVTINMQNIVTTKRSLFNYNYLPIDNYTEPYDFGSIVHFNSTMFSIDGRKKTIEPIGKYKNFYENMMGRIEEPSFYDYKVLNNYYCKNKCQNIKNCNAPCYQHPNHCNECACPTGYKSEEDFIIYVYGNKTICGYEQIYPTKRLQHLVRSNINYCFYHIETFDTLGHVFIRFPDFRGMFLNEKCSWKNSIEVRYKKNLNDQGICLCYHKDIEAPEIVSEGPRMIVIFNFNISQSYAHFEYMKVDSTDFKYESLGKYQKIPRLINEKCNRKFVKDKECI